MSAIKQAGKWALIALTTIVVAASVAHFWKDKPLAESAAIATPSTAKPDIVVHALPGVDPNLLIRFTSHQRGDLTITKVVINGINDPGCVWPVRPNSDGPHVSGIIDGKKRDIFAGPLFIGLGGGFDLVGFQGCGEPVEVSIETYSGEFTYHVTGS